MAEVVHSYDVINSGSPLRIYWFSRPQTVAQNSAQLTQSIHNTQYVFDLDELNTTLLEKAEKDRIRKHYEKESFISEL